MVAVKKNYCHFLITEEQLTKKVFKTNTLKRMG